MRQFDPNVPLFLQVKEDVENMILSGAVQEDERIPSVRELAREYQLNPNTINSAISELINDQIIYKKRGIGMFVQKGVLDSLRNQRRERFEQEEISRIVKHAHMLGMTETELIALVKRVFKGGV